MTQWPWIKVVPDNVPVRVSVSVKSNNVTPSALLTFDWTNVFWVKEPLAVMGGPAAATGAAEIATINSPTTTNEGQMCKLFMEHSSLGIPWGDAHPRAGYYLTVRVELALF